MGSILITGATGFVGKHLSKSLVENGHTVTGFGRDAGDIVDPLTWKKFPIADTVVHLAAKSFVPASWLNIAEFMNCNIQGTIEALNYCKEHKAHFIFISSYIYGNPKKVPIPEDSELVVNNPYALSKKMGEELCEFYAKNFDINVTILRPFNAYGPGQPGIFLIPSLIRQVKEGKEIQVKDLEPKRDFVHINDLVSAIVKAVEYDKKFEIFNIGSGISYSVKDLIDIIQTHANTNLPVISANERRKDEIMDTVADIEKAKRELRWQPEWTFSKGIEKILREYEATENKS